MSLKAERILNGFKAIRSSSKRHMTKSMNVTNKLKSSKVGEEEPPVM